MLKIRVHEVSPCTSFMPGGVGTHTANSAGGQPGMNRAHLTRREEQVLKLIAEGLTNRQIAQELQVSFKTVEKHRQEIMNRLGVHHTAGLTCYALANGLLLPETISASLAKRMPSSRGHWSCPPGTVAAKRAITARETQVLTLIAKGLVNKQIAAELSLSIKTVVNHRLEVMKRLNIHHIAGLTRYAVSRRIVALEAILPRFRWAHTPNTGSAW